MTQPNQSTLSRKWVLQVNTTGISGGAVTGPANTTTPVWTTVNGLADFTPSPGLGNIVDDSVYEDGGWTGRTKTALAWKAELKIMRRTLASDATSYDAGQEALRLLSLVLGPNGVAHVRWYDRNGGPEAYTGFAEVTWTNQGGSVEALEGINITLDGKGAPTVITSPAPVALPTPTITSVTPSTTAAAGGTLIKIIGTGIRTNLGADAVTGAGGVKLNAVNATSYFVDDANTIYAVSPATTAGARTLTLTNATGTSTGYPITVV